MNTVEILLLRFVPLVREQYSKLDKVSDLFVGKSFLDDSWYSLGDNILSYIEEQCGFNWTDEVWDAIYDYKTPVEDIVKMVVNLNK